MDHFYFEIPGWFNFHEIYDRALARFDAGHFVEVGCFLGCSTAYLAVNIINQAKDIRLDVVDHFEGSEEHQDRKFFFRGEAVDLGDMRATFERNLKRCMEHMDLRVVEGDSAEVASGYEDESLELVLLDASHDKESVIRDINAWRPKVSSGGMLAGDDLFLYGTKEALDELGMKYIPTSSAHPGWIWKR